MRAPVGRFEGYRLKVYFPQWKWARVIFKNT
jgi:hypothetical protein